MLEGEELEAARKAAKQARLATLDKIEKKARRPLDPAIAAEVLTAIERLARSPNRRLAEAYSDVRKEALTDATRYKTVRAFISEVDARFRIYRAEDRERE